MLLNIVFAVVLLILVILLVRSNKKLKRVSLNLGSTKVALQYANGNVKRIESECVNIQQKLNKANTTLTKASRDNASLRSAKKQLRLPSISDAVVELERQLKAKAFKGHQVSGVKTAVVILKKLN